MGGIQGRAFSFGREGGDEGRKGKSL